MEYLGMVLLVATTGIATFLLGQFDVSEPWRYVVAAFSVLPAILIAYGMLRSIRRQDELFQRVQFEAIAFAAILIWLFTFSWGFLEIMQLVPRIPAYMVATAILFLYAFGSWWFRRRYQ